MRLGSVLPGRVASAAMLALFVGAGAAAGAAPAPDLRSMVLAALSNDSFADFFQYPELTGYIANKPGFTTEEFLREAGAASVGLKDLGTEDERLSARVLVGRALALNGDKDRARTWLEQALADAVALGWSEARASGILRDLAWLADLRGEADAAAAYTARADTCPVPCADDAIPWLYAAATAAGEAVNTALGDAAYRRVSDLADANAITFMEGEYGSPSPELADAWLSRGYDIENDRPWQALEYLQRSIDIHRAAGLPQSMSTRASIADLMLQAGEYARLVAYAQTLATDAEAELDMNPGNTGLRDTALRATRLRARALWHLKDPGARAAFGTAIDTMFRFGSGDTARFLLQDLIDAHYDDEAFRVASALVDAYPGDGDALLAMGRIAARAGRYNDAAAWVGQIKDPTPIALLQRAAYLDKAGRKSDADFVRAKVDLPAVAELSWGGISDLTEPRDFGAYEGAAAVATTYLQLAEDMIASATYTDAQRLWQIAYTLALGGETAQAFRLMKAAASIAARLSFAEANDTDGGSLQLLRRDKFRYLLFVDIAWAAATGTPPDTMSVSSRY